MNAAFATPNNSTIVRSTSPWPLIRAYFAVASRVVPTLARHQAKIPPFDL